MRIPRQKRPQRAGSSGPRRNRAMLATAALAFGTVAVSTWTPAGAAPDCFGRQATIVGDSGDEDIRGTLGDDVIVGRGGADTIRGRGGKDLICGNRGEDVISGGAGSDKINGHQDIDYVEGNAGDDKMLGGGAGDELHGNIGKPSDHDVAKGAKGPDYLDVADGRGNDTAAGGAGVDTCVVDAGDTDINC